jgi:hypothetical protein
MTNLGSLLWGNTLSKPGDGVGIMEIVELGKGKGWHLSSCMSINFACSQTPFAMGEKEGLTHLTRKCKSSLTSRAGKLLVQAGPAGCRKLIETEFFG